MGSITARRIVVLIALAALLTLSVVAVAAAVPDSSPGPAPNAGDCIPDGSGLDAPFGVVDGAGPAPNAGDGIPDGSGF